MKYLLILMALMAPFLGAYEVNPEDYVKSPLEELQEISLKMEEMASKLRDDRADTTVQIQGKEIDERLAKLIKLIEDNKREIQTSKTSNQQPDRITKVFSSNNQQRRLAHPDWNQLIEPKKEEKPKQHSNWAQLPPTERDELLQVWAEEVPARWKKRIEAYFVSIAAVEKPKDDRKAEIVQLPKDDKDGDR